MSTICPHIVGDSLEAGAETLRPLAEQFWGELQGQLSDPFGHRWNIAQRVRDVSPAEIAPAAAEVFGQLTHARPGPDG